jgi:WD40 repeat protein
MVNKSKDLLKSRKKREVSATLSAPDAVAAMGCKVTAPCHKTSAHAIHAIAVAADAKTVATAGADGSVALFDVSKGKRASLLTGHSKKVGLCSLCSLCSLCTAEQFRSFSKQRCDDNGHLITHLNRRIVSAAYQADTWR